MADPTVLNEMGSDAAARDYVGWVAGAISWNVQSDLHGLMELVPTELPPEGDGEAAAGIALDSLSDLGQLWDLQRQFAGGAIEAEPSEDPSHVAGIAARVLQPYHVRDGHAQLAGCTLEPIPFLRISTGGPEITHHWFGRDGNPIAADLLTRLELERLVPVPPRLKEADRATVTAWIDAARSSLGDQSLAGVTVVWCRWVAGKVRIQFTQGEQTSLAFQGWAFEWDKGLVQPPLFKCPVTEIESYNLICLEDGTMTVGEAVGRCELTGQELMRSGLGQCTVSGKTVVLDMLTTCPISLERFLTDLAKKCPCCQRLVSPSAFDQQQCRQCSDLKSSEALNAIVAETLGRHPEYGKLSHWKGWVSDELALLVGRGWISETLLLVQTDDNQICRRGTRRRFSKTWHFDD